jgi:hypothetical protein
VVLQVLFWFVGIVVAALGLLVVWMLLKSNATEREDLKRSWLQAAEELGGQLTLHGLMKSSMRIEASVRDVQVIVDHYTTGGKARQHHTRIGARAPGPTIDLTLSREHALSGLTKALGAQDVEVGIPAIDEGFIIKTSDEDLCRALFQTNVGEVLQQAPGNYSFTLGGGLASGVCELIEENAGTMVSAVESTVALANSDTSLRDKWKELAESLGGTTTDASVGCLHSEGKSATISAEVGGANVVIDTLRAKLGKLRSRTRTFTRLRTQHSSAHSHPYAVFKEEAPEVLRGMFDAAAEGKTRNLEGTDYSLRSSTEEERLPLEQISAELSSIRPYVVADDGTDVAIVLEGVVLDATVLSTACSLIAELVKSARSEGYR